MTQDIELLKNVIALVRRANGYRNPDDDNAIVNQQLFFATMAEIHAHMSELDSRGVLDRLAAGLLNGRRPN